MALHDVRASEITDRRMTMIILGAFAVLALLLAAVGIYGVLSYSVNQNVPELGVRLALGAAPLSLLLLIVHRGMKPVLAGLGIGAVSAYAAGGILQSMLYGVSSRDGSTFALVSVILFLIALAACLIPGRRAMRLDPLDALRYE